jgi:TPP-dependent pyruvate/acetoin dehydrogenase alpha subunit
VFACENNLYSTHLPLAECRALDNIVESAGPFNVVAKAVDGNDVLAVYEAARHAVSECRAGRGPAFLELRTYRLRGHVGADDNVQGTHTDIRPLEEVAAWRGRDPLVRLRRYLREDGGVSDDEIVGVERAVQDEVASALAFARSSRFPAPEGLEAYVFRTALT